MVKALWIIPCLFLFISCSSDNDEVQEGELVNPTLLSVDSKTFDTHSSEVGNFVATAVQKANNLDFVFLPAVYYKNKKFVLDIKEDMSESDVALVVKHFKRGPQDQLQIGTMRGDRLKNFILQRTREVYAKELEVAGLWYSINYEGGFLSASNFSIDGKGPK